MDEVTSTETSPSSNQGVNDESPLWKYVTKVEKPPGASVKSGGNTYFKCNYCDNVYMGSYSRVKAHLLGISGKGVRACAKTKGHRQEMQQMHDKVENDKRERERRSEIPLPPPPPGRGLAPISPFRRQEGSDSTNPVDSSKRRKVTVNSP